MHSEASLLHVLSPKFLSARARPLGLERPERRRAAVEIEDDEEDRERLGELNEEPHGQRGAGAAYSSMTRERARRHTAQNGTVLRVNMMQSICGQKNARAS